MTEALVASPRLGSTPSDSANAFGAVLVHFDGAFNAAPHRALREIAGVVFDCRSSDRDYLERVRLTVGVPAADTGDKQRLLVECRAGTGLANWPAWSDPVFNEREFENRLAGGRYRAHYFSDLEFWQIYDRTAGRGLQLMTEPGRYPPWDPGSPLRNLLHWGLLESQAALLHAGTLARDGRGVLLAGSGGSGKSGTVAAGILNGLGTVGDDYVAVRADDDGVRAHAAFSTLKQDQAGSRRLGIEDRLPPGASLNWQGKHVVPIAALATAPQPHRIEVQAICIPHVSGEPQTSFIAATAREAFLALAPSGITQIPSARSEMFGLCARIARVLPAWHVALGTDPSEIAAAFDRFIAGLAQ